MVGRERDGLRGVGRGVEEGSEDDQRNGDCVSARRYDNEIKWLTRTLPSALDSFDKRFRLAESFLQRLNHRDENGDEGRPHWDRQERVDGLQSRLGLFPYAADIGLERRGRRLVRFAASDQRL